MIDPAFQPPPPPEDVSERQRSRTERGISKWDVPPEALRQSPPPPPPPLAAAAPPMQPEPAQTVPVGPPGGPAVVLPPSWGAATAPAPPGGPAVVLPPSWGAATAPAPAQVIGLTSPGGVASLTPQAAQVLALSPGLAQGAAPRPGSGTGAALEEGDWPCPQCQNVNFRRRPVCNRCGAPRPEGYGAPKSKGKGKGPSLNLYITGLPITFDADQLREYFAQWGEVYTAKVLQVKEGKTQAAGFVRMAEDSGRWVVENLCGSTQQGYTPPGLPNPINVTIIPDKEAMVTGEARISVGVTAEQILTETAEKIKSGDPLQWGTVRSYDVERSLGVISSPQMEVPCDSWILQQSGAGPGDNVMYFIRHEGNGPQAAPPMIRLAADHVEDDPKYAMKGWYKGICVADKGFGFIECHDLKIVFGKDVYVNKNMAGVAKQGWVAFNAKLQRDAKDGSLLPMCSRLVNCDETWAPIPGDLSQTRSVEIPTKGEGKGEGKKGDVKGGKFKGGDFKGSSWKGGGFQMTNFQGGSFHGGDDFRRSPMKGAGEWFGNGDAWHGATGKPSWNNAMDSWSNGWSEKPWSAGNDWGQDSWMTIPAMKGKGKDQDKGMSAGKGAWQTMDSGWDSSGDSWDWSGQSMGTKRPFFEVANGMDGYTAKMQKGGGFLGPPDWNAR